MAELPKEEPEACPAFLFIIRSTTIDKGGRYEEQVHEIDGHFVGSHDFLFWL
jgi:hypothetical protein